MYQIEYAALKYYNSIMSKKYLYIGILYNNITTRQRDFRYISDFKRFKSFDNEADINFIKTYLKGIKTQVENNIFNYCSLFDINKYIKIFVNEIRFTDVMKMKIILKT